MTGDEAQRAEQLLQQTIEHAAGAPYYRRVWGNAWRKVTRLSDLRRLPLLDKATASKFQHQLIVGVRPAGTGIVSSGTTRGESYADPLNVPQTAEEMAARASDAPLNAAEDPFPGWTLACVSVHHGLPKRLPGHDEIMLPWLHDANALAMLETTLRSPQPDGRRVTAMVIGSGPVKVLMAYLAQRGIDPRAFGVKLIGTFSFRLSSTWRRIVEEGFGAQVFDNYSLSEFPTPFTSCAACGWLHMGAPPVAWELLELERDRPAQKGPGRLIFTSLYPYVQAMPLVRYDTGDIAVRGPRCKATGLEGLRVLGRRRHGLVHQGTFVLNAVDVRDALEAQTEVEKTLHPMSRLGIVKSVDLGPPRWAVTVESGAPVLRFEVRFDPSVYRDRSKELALAVRRKVLESDSFTRGKKLVVEAVAAGSLKALTERYD